MACRNAGRCSVFSLALQGTESNCAGKFWRFDGEAAYPLSHASRVRFPFLSPAVTSSPGRGKSLLKGGALGKTGNVTVLPRPLTLGEVDASKASRRRGRGRYPNIRQTPPSGGLAAFAAILNKRFSPENRDQFFFSTGTIQPLVSGSLPHCIPVMVSYSFWVTGPILPSPM